MKAAKLALRWGVYRWYGNWWDIINTTIAVAVLVMIFLLISLIVIGALEFSWLPPVPMPVGRRFEFGLGLLGVTVSGGSVAAFSLVRVGTSRWSKIRRVRVLHSYFAEVLSVELSKANHKSDDLSGCKLIVDAYLQGTLFMLDYIDNTHKVCQEYFEKLRLECYTIRKNENYEISEFERIAAISLVVAVMSEGFIKLNYKNSNVMLKFKHEMNQLRIEIVDKENFEMQS